MICAGNTVGWKNRVKSDGKWIFLSGVATAVIAKEAILSKRRNMTKKGSDFCQKALSVHCRKLPHIV